MVNPRNLNLDELKEIIRVEITNHHPDRAYGADDDYYTGLVEKYSDRLNDDIVVRQLKEEVVRRRIASSVDGLTRSGANWLGEINENPQSMLSPMWGVEHYLLKVPEFAPGRKKPSFVNVRFDALLFDDVEAWVKWERKKAKEEYDRRVAKTEGALAWLEHMRARGMDSPAQYFAEVRPVSA